MRPKALVVSTVLALGVLSSQGRVVRAQTAEVDAVIKSVANAMGILRAVIEEESLMTIQYWGSGTMYEGGKPVKITNYYGSIAYDFPGMRVDFTRDGATPQRQIQVVSGGFAWDEVEEGGGLDAGLGKATPAMNAVNDRLLQLWTGPLGVVKAAMAAKANAKVTSQGGTAAITFSLTGPVRISPATNVVVGVLAGTPVTVTLNGDRRPERVQVRYGGKLIETTYSDYGDLNGENYLADVFFPRRIVQKVDGQTTWDLTITKTNTYNPYVIMPVPENVQKAAGR